jgi:hypothetical protein
VLAVVPSLVVSNLRLPVGGRVGVVHLAVTFIHNQEELPLGRPGRSVYPPRAPNVRTASWVKCAVVMHIAWKTRNKLL